MAAAGIIFDIAPRGMARRAVLALAAALSLAALAGCTSTPSTPVPDPNAPGIISTVAGVGGTAGYNGDNRDATTATLYWPQDVAVSPAGNLVVLDWNNHRVREISETTHQIRTVVGSGQLGDGAGGLATAANMNHPTGAAWDAQGRLIVAAWHNWKLKRLEADGTLTVIAGAGQGFAGDNGPAVGATPPAQFDLPSSVAFDAAGNMYISDEGNGRIRLVDAAGVVHTCAGIGGQGYVGDGAAAATARFNWPKGSDAFPSGRLAIDVGRNLLYVSDTNNHRVRVIDLGTGMIETIAGSGVAAYAGDDGPALAACLDAPTDIAVGPDHNIYIADLRNHCVRKVDVTTHVITTVAGTGTAGFSGDGGDARVAHLNGPAGVCVSPQGVLYIADTQNHVVRRVTLK